MARTGSATLAGAELNVTHSAVSRKVKALEAAQSKLEETASHDQALLASARQRTQELLSGYLTNIGAAVGKNYTIEWIEPETGGNSFDAADRESKTDPASEASE